MLAVALATTLALLLAACGDGSPTQPQTTTVTMTPTVTPTTPKATTSTPSTTTTTTAPPVTAPTTYAEAQQHFATGKADPKAGAAFVSPTGNIFCNIGSAAGPPFGCELKTGRIPPPTPDYCATKGGAPDVGRVEFKETGGPQAVCNTDSIVQQDVPVLQYGSVGGVAGSVYRCLSESIGMTCIDSSAQQGFFIARTSFRIF